MIPTELTLYPQWILWRYEEIENGKRTKIPYSAVTDRKASVTDPETWTTYDKAVAKLSFGQYSGLGFVLTENDPFAFIDLDDPQQDQEIVNRHIKILQAFNSYTELSPSEQGLHIIVKGSVPSGRRKMKVEVYSSLRYMTVTGRTYIDSGIHHRQDLLTQLWTEMDSNPTKAAASIIQSQQTLTDDELYKVAAAAENGQKFMELFRGEWQHHYPSQSEADYALINILGFYSRNVEQIRRLFYFSELGKRAKARREGRNGRLGYVDQMIANSFDNQIPLIDVEQATTEIQRQLAQIPQSRNGNHKIIETNFEWELPPGLLGDITKFIYHASPRPVKEISLAAAMGLMCGIVGRSYNVSTTGLNQYILFLAKTGTGKEAASSGIDRIMDAVKQQVPAAIDFVGPSELASGQALIKQLNRFPCFVAIMGEIGLTLQSMNNLHAGPTQINLRKTLLTLYMKSGRGQTFRQMIYSDKEKNTPIIMSPSFSLLGESTPENYYKALDEALITEGLLPRFNCIEYLGPRVPLNPTFGQVYPDPSMIEKISTLCANSLYLMQKNLQIEVEFTPEAKKVANEFEIDCTNKINSSQIEVSRHLWNRAHLKSMKIAAVIAVGVNPYKPTIEESHMQWAMRLVIRDIEITLQKFDRGQIGRDANEAAQVDLIVEAIREYMTRPYENLTGYQVSEQMHKDKVIPQSYIQRRVLNRPAFIKDRVGATVAMKRSIDHLINEGSLVEMKPYQIYNKYQKAGKVYMVMDVYRFA
jgi:Protein of unknown function (DUF3987)